MPNRLFSWTLFALALGTIMQPWFSSEPPLTVNSENIPEINYIWSLRDLIEQGQAFTPWNPKALGGEAVHSHLIYPLYWLIALISSFSAIPPETLYKFLLYIDLCLGAIFMYEFVLLLTQRPAAGLVAGLIFSLIPGHMNTIEGFFIKVSWLAIPLIFWLYERGFGQVKKPGPKDGVLLGLAVGLMGLASIQIPLMMILILPPYIVLREWQTQNRHYWPFERDYLQTRALAWLLAGTTALGLMAYYYIPLFIEFEHLAFTRFTDYPSGGTIALDFLIYMLTARWAADFSPQNFHEVTWYVGDVALILALIGLLSRFKTAVVIFFTLSGLLSLLLLVGHTLGPLPNMLYNGVEQLPLLDGVLRHSFRWILPLSLSLAVLAGFGTATLTTWFSKLTTKVATYGLMLLLALFLTFDYYPLHASFRTIPHYLRDSEIAAIKWLNQQDQNYRYFTPFANGTPRTYHLVFNHHQIQRPAVWDDQYVSHYVSKRAYTFFAGENVQFADLSSGLLDPLFLQMLDLGAVQHILIFLESYNHRDLFNTATALNAPIVFEQDEVRILLNQRAKALIQVYPKNALFNPPSPDGQPISPDGQPISPAEYTSADEAQLRAWLPRLTPKGIALLEGNIQENQVDYLLIESEAELTHTPPTSQDRALWPAQTDQLPQHPTPDSYIKWHRPAPTQVEAQVNFSQPTTLVLAESWYPGWHVSIDELEQPLLRANYVFQGVIVPPGKHTVLFEYQRPLYVRLAAGVSLITMLIAGWILLEKPLLPGETH